MASLFDRLWNRQSRASSTIGTFASIYEQAKTAHAAQELERAIFFYDQALLVDPRHAECYYGRANALKNLGELHAALQSYDRALECKPDYSYAYCNRGAVQQSLGLTADALASYERAIALDPSDARAHYNRALLLQELSRWEEAIESYDRSIAADPEFADAHYNQAVAYLFLGDFERGWRGFEWRWRIAPRLGIGESRDFDRPLWSGTEPIIRKRILLHSEAGLGDTIQFSRYATRVAARGAVVCLEVQPPLVSLLGTLEGVSKVIAKGERLPDFDFHCPLMSLPLAFKTMPDTIPASPVYLRSDPARVEHWRSRVGRHPVPRIGLAWSGNPKNPIDQRRTARLAQLLEYLPTEYEYFCLQKDVRQEDLAILEMTPFIKSFGDELGDFSETAALCECMDVVVSVDTSLAHLSASLGRPTWLLLPFVPDWRWFRNRQDTPWYPTAVLYRQKSVGDWAEVFIRVARDLRERFGHQVLQGRSIPE